MNTANELDQIFDIYIPKNIPNREAFRRRLQGIIELPINGSTTTQAQLREDIVNRVLDEMAGKYDNPREYMNAIMAKVQEYVNWVIGPDLEADISQTQRATGKHLFAIRKINDYKKIQRKRAGI